MSLIEKIGMALCQNALGGKHCPCAETGQFKCAEAYPGYQAQAALTAIMGEGDGVQDVDREAAFNTGIRLTKREWIGVYETFARHRALAIAAGRAAREREIVEWLRDLAHESQRKAAAPIADAIERGEV